MCSKISIVYAVIVLALTPIALVNGSKPSEPSHQARAKSAALNHDSPAGRHAAPAAVAPSPAQVEAMGPSLIAASLVEDRRVPVSLVLHDARPTAESASTPAHAFGDLP